MKQQMVLSLALLLSASMMAQEKPALRDSTSSDANTLVAYSALPQSSAQTKSKTAASPNTDTGINRPKSEGSMVGYIEDATIGSKIRIRFDAASNTPAPDRAEFFYAKCGCYKLLVPPGDPAFDPKAPGPGPGVPTNLNFQQLYVTGEYAPSRRFSVFVDLPFRWIQPQGFLAGAPFPNQGGISDIRAGVKLGLATSENAAVTFQFKSYFPSGDAARGLGTNHYSIEPALLLYYRFAPRVAVEGQFGDWHPINGSHGVPITSSEGFAGDVLFYGVGPSVELYRSEGVAFAPVVELVGWHVLGGFQTVLGAPQRASGTDIVNMKFGGRVTIRDRNSFYVGYGRGLTDADWYRDIVRVEYRHIF
jgi:Putative MetA-pathway of phenol degradation